MPLQVIRLTETPVEDEALRDVQRGLVQRVNRFQDGLASTINALEAAPMFGGRLMTSVSIGIAATEVFHRLGRAPLGWLVTRKSATCDVWESGVATNDLLYLVASAAVTVDLLVF